MPTVLKPHFRCGECMMVHEDEDEARECCVPEVSECYVCPLCCDDHDDEDQAFECCGFDPDGPPPREREAAGQLRLLP